MTNINRRAILAGSAAAAVGAVTLPALAQETGGAATTSLQEALRLRRSTRRFAADDLPEEQILRLLWAANGINRPELGLSTAPSWRSAHNVDIYVAHSGGVGRYEAEDEIIEPVSDTDIREIISPTAFVATAPITLIYVSDHDRLADAAGDLATTAPQALVTAAYVNSALIAQNVYLFAAAEGLGTCVLGTNDGAAIAEALSFPETLSVTYVQPVGIPR